MEDHDDALFCRIARERGLISEEQEEEVRSACAELAGEDGAPGAAEMLIRDGLLTEEQAQEIRDAVGGGGDAPAAAAQEIIPEARPAEPVEEEIPEARPAEPVDEGPPDAKPAGADEAESKAAEREAKRKATRVRIAERKKIPPEERKKKGRNPFFLVGAALVVLAAAALAVFFVFLQSRGPSLDEVMKKVKGAEKRGDLAGALENLDAYLAEEPGGEDGVKAREERDRIGAAAAELVAGLETECAALLDKGDAASLGEAVSKGDTLRKLAPLVGKDLGALKERLDQASTEWSSQQDRSKQSDDAFATGKVSGTLHVPAGKFFVAQPLEVGEGATLKLGRGAELRMAEDKDLAVRKGGTLILEPGSAIHMDGSSEIAVNEGAKAEFQEGSEVLFGPEAGLTALGPLKAEGTADRPVRFGPLDESEGWFDVLLDGKGAAGSVLRHVEVKGGQGRTIAGIKEAAGALGGGFAVVRGAKVVFENIHATFCIAGGGGGIFVFEAEATLKDCILEACKGSRKGGGLLAGKDAVVRLEGGRMEKNDSFQNGGALAAEGGATLTVSGTLFKENKAQRVGGALWMTSKASVDFADAVFEENMAGAGGAVYTDEAGGAFVKCRFERNRAGGGGGAVELSDTGETPVRFEDCEFKENACQQDKGGALSVGMGSRADVKGGAFRSNQAPNGGAVSLETPASLKFEGVEFEKNTAVEGLGRGGAIVAEPLEYIEGITGNQGALPGLEIVKCTFKENTSRLNGGAVSAKVTLVRITDSVFEKNRADGGGNGGGGALSGWGGSRVEVTDSRFVDNRSGKGGGAVLWRRGGELRCKKSVFEENEADDGGAVDVEEGRALFEDCEFAQNKARTGAGIIVQASREKTTLELKNCVFRSNESTRRGGAVHVGLETKGTKAVEVVLRAEGGRMEGNRAPTGGALSLEMKGAAPHRLEATLKNLEIASNEAREGAGGGVSAVGPLRLDCEGVRLSRNRAQKEGGGLFVSGAEVNLHQTSVKDNEGSTGGGVFWKGAEPKLGEGTGVTGNKPDDVVKGE